jgi:hypothetical protein
MSHHYSGPDFGFPRGDARLDFTDLYAFPKPGEPGKSVLIMNVHPSASENPPGPTVPEPFAPEAVYEFKLIRTAMRSQISHIGYVSRRLWTEPRVRHCAAPKARKPLGLMTKGRLL